jgi:anti-sigma28 factor (negative regulator of flagellin synthesis)
MQINQISQSMQSELRKIDGSQARTAKEQPTAKAGDRSELSAHGKLQSETKGDIQIISSMIKAQPDVRTEKVADVQAKIGDGFYNTGAFADKLAEKLAGVLA